MRWLPYQRAFIALGTGLILGRAAHYVHALRAEQLPAAPNSTCYSGARAGPKRPVNWAEYAAKVERTAAQVAKIDPAEARAYRAVNEIDIRVLATRSISRADVSRLVGILRDEDRWSVCHILALRSLSVAASLGRIADADKAEIRAIAEQNVHGMLPNREWEKVKLALSKALSKERERALRIGLARRLLRDLDKRPAS